MSTQNLATKLLQQSQRRCLTVFLQEISDLSLKESITEPQYFPSSSSVLCEVLSIIKLKGITKSTFFIASANLMDKQALAMIRDLQPAQELLCFFPNYSYREKAIVSDLPVLKVKAESAESWYRFNALNKSELHFFCCATIDLSKGMVVDMYAGNPEISGSD